MPTSSELVIQPVLDIVMKANPSSILDVGIGFGKWGVLFREYLDIRNLRYNKEDWLVRIDGIEIFDGYTNPIYTYAYDSIYFGDVRTKDISDYDLIYLGDVIEHLEKEEAFELLDKLITKGDVLVSTPNGFFKQGEVLGNENEIHKCGFSKDDFTERYGKKCKVLVKDYMLVVLIKCQKN